MRKRLRGMQFDAKRAVDARATLVWKEVRLVRGQV